MNNMKFTEINFVAMPRTAMRIVTAPASFFKNMPKTGGYLEPLVFVIIMGAIAGLIQITWIYAGFTYSGASPSGLMSAVNFPIAAAAGSFISAGITYGIWKLLGSQNNYQTAYRCMAYLTVLAPITALLSAIPYAGGILNMAIFVFYIVTASTQVHNVSSRKAWLTFGIIGIVLAAAGFFLEYSARHISWDQKKPGKVIQASLHPEGKENQKGTINEI
jgi:hypothetical protein